MDDLGKDHNHPVQVGNRLADILQVGGIVPLDTLHRQQHQDLVDLRLFDLLQQTESRGNNDHNIRIPDLAGVRLCWDLSEQQLVHDNTQVYHPYSFLSL